jgi:hypothetical protein
MVATLRGVFIYRSVASSLVAKGGQTLLESFLDQGVDSDFKARIIRLLAAMNASGQAASC